RVGRVFRGAWSLAPEGAFEDLQSVIVEYVQTTAGKNIMPMGILSLKYSFKISFLYYLLILKHEVNGE
ncbi:hypothetical protein, partial [Pectobacterium versatile]|uniref:hypothetical protein n=1 Tax=Pectobacterium versatile TaxID=2488639 RepID=UPI001B372461